LIEHNHGGDFYALMTRIMPGWEDPREKLNGFEFKTDGDIMEPNYFIFTIAEMKKYCQKYKDDGDTIDWAEILQLNRHPIRISFIHVVEDHDFSKVLAYAEWGWNNEDGELKFAKIRVKDKSLRRHKIGTVMMKMVIAIAQFYEAPRITGTVTGEPFLWDWYPKLGFAIYDRNKLLLEIKIDT
jgi:hypothetical protein